MWHNLLDGLTTLGNGPSIAYLVAGSLIGMFIGVIPGLGGIVLLSVVLAFIKHISLEGTIALFLAVQAGSFFSASITSILLNTPAHPEAFAVTFDGFPMAQKGEAGRALGISATSTCIGGVIGCICLVAFIPVINWFATSVHPPEYVGLTALAMLLVGTLGTDSVGKGIASAGIGLMIASIGPSNITGSYRFTFGTVGLSSGVSIVALALGCFAIPQMVLVYGTATTVARQDMTGRELADTAPVHLEQGFRKQVIGGLIETLHHRVALFRAAIIGVITGVVPGIGAFAANFLSYGVAQQWSKRRQEFGTGIPEGIIAPEGSSLSKEAGGLIPLLGLGIPGGIGGALFLAALTLKGITPGFGFTHNYPTLAYEMAWIVLLGGIIGTTAGLFSAPLLAKVTRVPGPALVPFIIALSVVGPWIADVAFFSVMEVVVFAIVGFLLRRLRYSLASFVVGLVLGPTFENNIYLTHSVYKGWTFLLQPASDVMLAIAIGLIVLKTVQNRRDKRAAKEKAELEHTAPMYTYPMLGLGVTTLLFATVISFTLYAAMSYSFATAIMPVLAGSVTVLGLLSRVPNDVRAATAFRSARRLGTQPVAASEPTAMDLEPESAPLLASVGLTALTAVLEAPAFVEVETTPSGLPPVLEKRWGRHGQYTREVVLVLWLITLVAACRMLGFTIAIVLFCLAYGMTSMRRVFPTIRGRIGFAVGSAAVLGLISWSVLGVLHLPFIAWL